MAQALLQCSMVAGTACPQPPQAERQSGFVCTPQALQALPDSRDVRFMESCAGAIPLQNSETVTCPTLVEKLVGHGWRRLSKSTVIPAPVR